MISVILFAMDKALFDIFQLSKPKTRGAWFDDPDALEQLADALKVRAAHLRAQNIPQKAKGAPGANPISIPDEDTVIFFGMNALRAEIRDGRHMPAEGNHITGKGWKRPVARELLARLKREGKSSRAGLRKGAEVEWTVDNLMKAYDRGMKLWTEHLTSQPDGSMIAALFSFTPPPRVKKSSVK